VIGAAHAGWRGALGGVLQNTINAMIALGAQRPSICAAIGPCIRQQSYQVGEDVREAFTSIHPEAQQHFAPDIDIEGRFRFDLGGFVGNTLRDAGLSHVEDTELDTYADELRFFSYRRTTHRNEPDYGRSLSAITLSPRAK